jgi:hypothetical protein
MDTVLRIRKGAVWHRLCQTDLVWIEYEDGDAVEKFTPDGSGRALQRRSLQGHHLHREWVIPGEGEFHVCESPVFGVIEGAIDEFKVEGPFEPASPNAGGLQIHAIGFVAQ